MSGGKSSFPLTVRVKAGVGFGAGSQHSHNLEAWIAHSPGLKIVWPATVEDAKGLLLSAIFDPDPVIVVEDMMLYRMQGEFPDGDVRTPLGKARVAVPGTDCTVIAYGMALYTAMKAMEPLSENRITSYNVCYTKLLRSRAPHYVVVQMPLLKPLITGETGTFEISAHLKQNTTIGTQSPKWNKNTATPLVVWLAAPENGEIEFFDKDFPQRLRHHIMIEFDPLFTAQPLTATVRNNFV